MKAKGLLLATIMLVSLVPVTALAAHTGKGVAAVAQKPDWTAELEQQRMNFEEAKMQFKNDGITKLQFRAEVRNYLGTCAGAMGDVAERVRDRAHDAEFEQFLNRTKQRLQDNSSEEDLVSIAKEMKQQWNQYRIKAKSKINQEASEKMTGIILNANGLASRLNATIQKLKGEGKDTSALEGMLMQFQEKISLAYEHKLAAKEQLKNAGDSEQLQNQAHEELQEAHQYLKQAHRILKEIVMELKSLSEEPLLPVNETNESEQVTE